MIEVFLQRRFHPPLSDVEVGEIARTARELLEAGGGEWQESYVDRSRERLLCRFKAPDVQSVRRLSTRARRPRGRLGWHEVPRVKR